MNNNKTTSWTCRNCINTVDVMTDKGVFTYCRPAREHRLRTEWQGNFLACLDKIEGQQHINLQEAKNETD